MSETILKSLIRLRIAAVIAIILAFVVGIAFTFVRPTDALPFKFTLAIATITTLLNFVAVPFFLIGLKKFKVELKRAYIILCIGIALFGLAQLQLPIVNLYNLWFWVNYGGIALPYLLAVVFIFWGARDLARLLNIRTLWTSFTVVIMSAVGLGVLGSFLPHLEIPLPEISYDISLGLSIWDTVFAGFAAVVIWQCKQTLGPAYASSMVWLCRALATLSFGGLHYSIIQLLYTDGDWYYDYSFTIIPFLLGALLLVKAGYEFNTIYEISAKKEVERRKASSVEVITYVASLASNPSEVDPILNNVRAIAEKYSPEHPLSSAEQATLASAYIQLENYLTEREALRIFTKEGLRDHVNRKFELDSSSGPSFSHFFSQTFGD